MQQHIEKDIVSKSNFASNIKLTGSMKAVLKGVKESQPARAREVIQRCGSLSDRTIKRSLKELVQHGYVIRDVSNGSARYRIAEE